MRNCLDRNMKYSLLGFILAVCLIIFVVLISLNYDINSENNQLENKIISGCFSRKASTTS